MVVKLKNEFKKIQWAKRTDVVEGIVQTLLFTLFFSGFFFLVDILLATVLKVL